MTTNDVVKCPLCSSMLYLRRFKNQAFIMECSKCKALVTIKIHQNNGGNPNAK